MSGSYTVPSAFLSPQNTLLSQQIGGGMAQATVQNQLLQNQGQDLHNQGAQQQLGENEMDVLGRAAAGVLAAPAEQRPALYQASVANLQRNGFAKSVSSQYPGDAALQQFVSTSMPLEKQYQLGIVQPPGLAGDLARIFGGGGQPGATAPGGSGQTGGGTGQPVQPFTGANLPAGVSPSEDQLVRTVYGEARGEPVAGQQAVASVIKTRMRQGNQSAGDVVFAPNQFESWSDPKNRPGMEALDPNSPQYQQILNGVVRPVMSGQAQDPTGGATNFYNPVLQAQLGRGTPSFAQGNATRIGNHTFYYGGYAPGGRSQVAAATPQQGAPGATATPAPYQVATSGPNVPGPTPGPVAAPQGAPAPAQTAQGGAPAAQPPGSTPAPQQPPAATTATGVNSPQYQQATQMLNQAAYLRTKYPTSPAAKNAADALEQRAKMALSVDSVIQNPDGTQTKVLSGETIFPPTGRPFTTASGDTGEILPGGGSRIIAPNPSGVTGSGEQENAMRVIATIGPKINAGTATPQEQANYATAADTYRQPQVKTDPNTQALTRFNTRELPAGMPEPPASAGGSGTTALTQGQSIAQRSAEEELGKNFATTDKKSYDASNTSMGMLASANNAAEILNRTPGGWTATGAGSNTRMELGKTVNQIGGLFGVPPVVDPEKIGEWEALNKQTRLMGMQVVNNYFGGSREAASIINGATTAVPNSENTYLGFRMVSSGIEQDLIRQKELYEFKAQTLSQPGASLLTAEAQFNKAHPVQEYTQRAIANAVPDDIASVLIANPGTVRTFDQHFGPGIGEFILKGGRTRLGAMGGGQSGGGQSSG